MTVRYGILVDVNRCTGCMTCVLACKQENLTPPGVWWNKVLEIEEPTIDYIHYVRYSCIHCDNPPCVEACPEKAIQRREDGIVIIDQEKCRGRGECRKACPYGAIDINPAEDYFSNTKMPYQSTGEPFRSHLAGKASKCTLCLHRIEKGREPACVEACPSRAMMFGDLNDLESPIAIKCHKADKLMEAKKTNPGILYIVPENLSAPIEKRIEKNPRMDRLY
jgi:Fe-S-cluster-containing dehydrogenase component